MQKYLLLFLIAFCMSIVNVKADTTYIRGNIAPDTTNVAVRTCASVDCPQVKNDTNGNISISYPEMFEILGEEGDFYKISLQYTGFWYEGYILKGKDDKAYVQKSEFTITDELLSSFKEMGFSESYALKLAKLKISHPNWNFVPYEVNATFDEVIAGESKYIDTNLIDSSNQTLRSTEDGSYINGEWKTFSGGKWYAASKQTIKYYVDPRNFLNDGHIFMFEKLNYDAATQTEEAIISLLNGTFMAGNTFYYNENNEQVEVSYAKAFADSASQNDVSAIHLVSRVIQEQGVNGSSLSSGDNAEFPGFYNYFNIHANGGTTAEVIHNGLAYAKKHNWSSPYSSILGGGNLLNSYIKNGQNTLYLQKFDFVGSTYYTNQYMQNIRAPYTESYSAYKTYVKNNLLDSFFTFSIPVFKGDMPTYTSLNSDYNEDTTLSMLNITNCNLMPSFISSAYNYTCSLGSEISKVTISATPTTADNVVEGTGEIELADTVTNIEVTVTSKSGSKGIYKIVVNKTEDVKLSPDEILSKLQINNNSGYLSGFDLGSEAYYLSDLIRTNYPSSISTVSKEGKLATGMTLKVTNNGEADYTIVIYGDNNGDGEIDIVDLLKVQKSILGASKLEGAYLKASDVNKDGEVDIVDLLKIQKHILNVSKIEQ